MSRWHLTQYYMVPSQIKSRNQYRTTDLGIPALATIKVCVCVCVTLSGFTIVSSKALFTLVLPSPQRSWFWNLRHQCPERIENPSGVGAMPGWSHLRGHWSIRGMQNTEGRPGGENQRPQWSGQTQGRTGLAPKQFTGKGQHLEHGA